MKNILSLICIIALLYTVSTSVGAGWELYNSIEELIHGNERMPEKTVLIITGIAMYQEETEIFTHSQSTLPSEVTITTIKITEVVYGDVGANTIEVVAHGYKNPHSNGDGLPARVPGNGGQFLEKGQEYLFFLFAPFEGRYMSNHPRRSYAIDSEGNVIDEDDILGVSSVENIKQFLAASFGKPKPSADSRSGNNSSVITAPNSTTDSTTNSAANNDTNPRTGITLGIIPMFVVGCAALISKNRKK